MNMKRTILILVALMAIIGTASATIEYIYPIETLYPGNTYIIDGYSQEGTAIHIKLKVDEIYRIPTDGTRIMITANLYYTGIQATLTPDITNIFKGINRDYLRTSFTLYTNTADIITFPGNGISIQTQIILYK